MHQVKMPKRHAVGIVIMFVALVIAVHPVYATVTSYAELVSRADADLKAGRLQKALTESRKAIELKPTSWQAYAVAGGALQYEGAYDSAIEEFSKSLRLAPEGKRAAIRRLLRRCLTAESSAQSRSGLGLGGSRASSPRSTVTPSYAETLEWIQTHIREAGDPRNNSHPCPGCTWSQKYLISFDGCSTMTISVVNHRTYPPGGIYPTSDINFEEDFAFPIPSTKINRDDTGAWVHLDPSMDGLLMWREVGVPDSIRTTHRASIPNRVKDLSDWKAFMDAGGSFAAGPDDTSGPGVAIPFELLGTEDVAPHFVNAVDHLLEICRDHPDEVPKAAF